MNYVNGKKKILTGLKYLIKEAYKKYGDLNKTAMIKVKLVKRDGLFKI